MTTPSPSPAFAVRSIRPLVRYVDEAQAVIDVWFELGPADPQALAALTGHRLDVQIELTAAEGYAFRHHARTQLKDRSGVVRFELKHPSRWWPLGMGEQFLYDMTVTLSLGDEVVELWQTTLGLTSVRLPREGLQDQLNLLVNGQVRRIESIVPVQPVDEAGVLPVGDQTLLVIRDHFGPDVLYEAADRAGVLVLQSIPASALDPATEGHVVSQVDRLIAHPSLVGWLVDAAAPLVQPLTARLRQIDPTRGVLHRLP